MFNIFQKEINENISLLEIQKNGAPVSPENSVNEKEELADFFAEINEARIINSEVLIISGMPLSFVLTLALAIKNTKAQSLAVHNPRLGGAFIVHSVSPDRKVGDFIEV
jgi:hypothetical protein